MLIKKTVLILANNILLLTFLVLYNFIFVLEYISCIEQSISARKNSGINLKMFN
jgi:hypothetical protein